MRNFSGGFGRVPLQSPELPAALRRELALAGSGAFSCELDPTINPVVIVGDTRSQRQDTIQEFVAGCYRAAGGAGTYNRFQFAWYRAARISRIEVTRIVVSGATAMAVYIGWANPQPVGTSRTIQSLLQMPANGQASPAGDLFDDNSAVAPVSSEYAIRRVALANTPLIFEHESNPFVLNAMQSAVAPGLNITIATANVDAHVVIEWRELQRP